MPDSIRQGETFDFETTLSGNASGFTATMNLMQYPGDTPTVTRVLTQVGNKFKGTLTSVETLALTITGPTNGEWWIYTVTNDPDEDIREPAKLYVFKGWTT